LNDLRNRLYDKEMLQRKQRDIQNNAFWNKNTWNGEFFFVKNMKNMEERWFIGQTTR
jgi:hypothetical protein